ncbi:MAG: lytic transglycosylase domain-containing protein [Pyrinomonadaceae bacterium]
MTLTKPVSRLYLRYLLFALIACALMFMTAEVGSARGRKRSGRAVRRSHAVDKSKAANKSDSESDSKALLTRPQLKLKDGTVIPVDSAWENAQGFWYQQNGVTYLVDRAKVSAIEGPPVEKSRGNHESNPEQVLTHSENAEPKANPVWIHLVGGARVKADEAAESAAGVWLKRGTFSVFIERSRIERIEREEFAADAGPKSKASWSTGRFGLDALIKQNGARHGVDPYLIFLVMEEESHFNPRAVSPKGARGLMQLMPGTGARFGVRRPFDPADNISGGVRYLKQLLQIYNGRVDLVLASYNAGEGAVAKFGHRVPPYRETRNYVKRIGGRYHRNEIAKSARRPEPQATAN